MTNAQHIAMLCLIFAALLFVGSSMSSEVDNSLLSEVFLNPLEDGKAEHNTFKKPSLQTKESTPKIGTYKLRKSTQGCVMAKLGVEFVVKDDKKTFYFNMDPNTTRVTGYCTDQKAVLSLEFYGGSLEFTFIKNGDKSYVRLLRALLQPEPPCKQCKGKLYRGVWNSILFQTTKGRSFKCHSKTFLKLAENLMIKIISLQIQAFDLSKDTFGKETECWADYNKRIIPIVVAAVVAGIILISILVCVLIREHRGQGYEQL